MSKLSRTLSVFAVTLVVAGGTALSSAQQVSASKTKFGYYKNINNGIYKVANKNAIVYSTGKLTHKRTNKLGKYGAYVTGYYAAHVTRNGKKMIYYKFKTSSGSTGWVWRGWLKATSNNETTSTTVNGTSNSEKTQSVSSFMLNQSEYVNAFLSELNQERKQRGLSALTLDSTLTQIATNRSREISTNFTHYDTNGVMFASEYAKSFGLSYSTLGEVITQNYPTAPTLRTNGETWGEDYDETSTKATLSNNPTSAELAHSDLMTYLYDDASSDWGHRDILLSTKYTKVGIAAFYNPSSSKYSYSAADLSN